MDSTKEMTAKLKSLTSLDQSPDMDSIIGSQTLAFFQQALHKFKTEINSVYTNKIKQFITNRQALTDEKLEAEYIDRGQKITTTHMDH